MIHLFKTYLQTLGLFVQVKEDKNPLQIRKYQHETPAKMPKDLNYNQVQKAMLISEYDDSGEERPIAIAFINQKNKGMVIAYLHDLSEIE